jgi:hypothetical protein
MSTNMQAGGSFDHGVEFFCEDGMWSAECNDFPGWSALADTRDELVELVTSGIEFLTGEKGHTWYWWHHDITPQEDHDA